MKKGLSSCIGMVLLLFGCAVYAAERPNIIFILGDDQAWWDYSFMYRSDVEAPALDSSIPKHHTLYQAAQTPAIDRLADEGLAFTHGYTVPLCRPSLQAMISGMFPHQNRISGNDMVGDANDEEADQQITRVQSLARTLVKRLGYRAFQTGKWWGGHHTLGGFTEGDTMDTVAAGTGPSQYTGSRPSYANRGRHGDWGLMVGRVDYVSDIQAPEHPINYANTIVPLTDFIDDCVANDDTFFAWYAPFLPHEPHDPPAGLWSKYDALIEEPNEDGNYHAKYYANIERLDGGIGAILDHLEEKGIADNTMIIFICDNGWINLDNSSKYAPRSKTSPYEGGVRTPIIVHWPKKIKAGGSLEPQVVTQPVSVIDMVTTALAAVDLQPTPEQRGVNLMDLSAVNARDAIYCDVYAHDMASLEHPEETLVANFVVKDGWKLLVYPDDSTELFYLYEPSTGDPVDPFETNDLSTSNPTKTAELLGLINTWYDEPKDMDWSLQGSQINAGQTIEVLGGVGQSITVQASSYLSGIKIPLRQVGSNQTITLDVRELDGGGAPLGELISSVTLTPDPVFTNGLHWCLFPLSPAVPVSAGQQLGFQLKTSGQFWIPYNKNGGYGGGKMYFDVEIEGAAWAEADYDLAFQTLHGNYNTTRNSEIRFDDGQVHASVDFGVKRQPVLMQSTTNLVNGWVDLGEDENLDGLVAIADTLQTQKFYRFALSQGGDAFALDSPPTWISRIPANGSTNVSPSAVLSLTFDKEIKVGTGNITLHLSSDNSVVQTLDVTSGNISVAGSVMAIKLTEALSLSTEYYVNIPAGAVTDLIDLSWPGISGSTDWTFTSAAELTAKAPTHHWAFDEGSGATTAIDSGGSNDGAISGALWASDSERGAHLTFDGTDDRVDPSLFLPQWTASNAETWAVWIKDAGGNDGDILLGNRLDGQTAAGGRLFAKMTIGTTSGRFAYNDGNVTPAEFSTLTPGYSGDFPDGTWVHLAIVRNGSDFTFYVDGDQVNDTPVTIAAADMPAAAMPFFVGGELGASATEHFKGGLDDVVIYDKALNAGEVILVMNGTYDF